MLFRQLVHREGEAVAYLVACEKTRKAALIDPVEGAEPRYRKLLAELELQLVYVLETTATAASPTKRGDQPYATLLAELGLDQTEPAPASATAHERLGAPRIGPVSRWSDEGDGPSAELIQLVDADGHILELSVCSVAAPGRDLCRIGGPRPSTFRLRYDRLVVHVGELEIEAWATGLTENTLAYVMPDRAITGTTLTGLTGDPAGGAPHALLALPPDTLLYPTRTPNDVFVSNVHQERLLRARPPIDAPLHKAPDPATPAWSPVVHQGGATLSDLDGEIECPEVDDEVLDTLGMPHPEGYREVHPGDLYPVIEHFRVLDLRDAAEFGGPLGHIAGAERMSLRELSAKASQWDPHERLVLVSEYGFRCRTAAGILVRMGFTRLFRVVGGMVWWTESGLPVERAPQRSNGRL
jgi:rhodanese-related sulfurtransferase